jgi:hypothetical protein
MLYRNINKILSILFIQFFYIIFNALYIKYHKLNKIEYLVNQNGENNYKYNKKYIQRIKKVVYSILIGKYDKISTFAKQKDYKYFLFSDIKYDNTNWTIIPFSKIKKKKISKIKMTRYIKLFPHLFFKNYELSIYIDASYVINGDLNELLLRALNPSFDLYLLQHPERNKVFQEFSAVIYCKKEKKRIVNLVKKRYKKTKFPDKLELTENSIIIRRHNNKNIIKLMKAWWNEIKNYSYRDQLSLNYAIWKLNLKIKIYYLPKQFMLDYFIKRNHTKKVKY